MINYQMLPNKPFFNQNVPYCYWKDGFNDYDINQIFKISENYQFEQSVVGSGDDASNNPNIRRSNIKWFNLNDDTRWIFDKISYIARELNSQYYNFDLYGFTEALQFTEYRDSDQGFYDWHNDCSHDSILPRKLSIVLQLTDPSEYEGGDLEILNISNSLLVEKQKGFLVAFPSYTVHKVSPVTKGKRNSLVVWLTGPAFK